MDASMLGVGVGFDTRGAGRVALRPPGSAAADGAAEGWAAHVVGDSREGWVASLVALLEVCHAATRGRTLPSDGVDGGSTARSSPRAVWMEDRRLSSRAV